MVPPTRQGGPLREGSESAAKRLLAMIEAGALSLSDARMMADAGDKAVPLTVQEAVAAVPAAGSVDVPEALKLADISGSRRLRLIDAEVAADLDWLVSEPSPLAVPARRWPWTDTARPARTGSGG